ncbi:hypothetical protein GJAV_G00163300 [Gymnothorax javanicus]|nr:hypothetical protein GJAV_G00163300 [Gymnothorax javanicus]
MRFNATQLAFLSRGPPRSFDREGKFWVDRLPPGNSGHPQDAKERWCRLKGNLLFLMKKPVQVSQFWVDCRKVCSSEN